MTINMPTKFTNARGQIVGILHADKTFRKRVRKSAHLLNILDAWGIDESILTKLGKAGCKTIKIEDSEEKMLYEATFDVFTAFGIEKNFVGRQLFLPRRYFSVIHMK